MKINSETTFNQINLNFISLILCQKFGITNYKSNSDQLLSELSQMRLKDFSSIHKLNLNYVINTFKQIIELSKNMYKESSPITINNSILIVLDKKLAIDSKVRKNVDQVYYLFDDYLDFYTLDIKKTILILSESNEKSYSALLQCRTAGLNAFLLVK